MYARVGRYTLCMQERVYLFILTVYLCKRVSLSCVHRARLCVTQRVYLERVYLGNRLFACTSVLMAICMYICFNVSFCLGTQSVFRQQSLSLFYTQSMPVLNTENIFSVYIQRIYLCKRVQRVYLCNRI